MLFGLSYVFGATGTTYLADLLPKLAQLTQSPIGVIGLLLAMAGFFFKLSVFPFHFWAPDVYQGAANQVTASSPPRLRPRRWLFYCALPPWASATVTASPRL